MRKQLNDCFCTFFFELLFGADRRYFLIRCLLFGCLLFGVPANTEAQSFWLTPGKTPLMILYNAEGPKLDSVAAYLLADDVQRVTGVRPRLITASSQARGQVIVIGNAQSRLVRTFISDQSPLVKKLQGRWECFALKIVEKPSPLISQALVVAGSDARGTAYGVFTLSEKIGVSPWYWWADVPVAQQKQLVIHQPEYVSATPSVKYRGIFINDEDWGLRPWAANTFEPALKNIGPKTYAKIFELLLRLKANLVWPAMHPGTAPFYSVPGNKEMASLFSIVIGSSHAEPMLRNNVGEWDEKTMGHFNYLTNKQKVFSYWEDRVRESSEIDVIYSMGMRGVHDSQMEGVKSAKEAVPLLEKIFEDQRSLLKKYQPKNGSTPQVLTPYKEVLEFYDAGLTVPDDITLVWPDDNYGYIQRLSNEQERKRSGGAGVYYHASYWGRPHDYLWLSSTHPSLIREEMIKAYQTGADRLWVLNVGDIKPLEYNLQLFLDMAYNTTPFKASSYSQSHLLRWHEQLFGKQNAKAITGILWRYYQLAFERRPEFMGWSRTEPTTKTNHTAYHHFFYGDEAQRRIDAYDALEKGVEDLRRKIALPAAAAFYQLVYYPVVGASAMNKKFLYRDKAYLYAAQGRISAGNYAAQSQAAYERIVAETANYNSLLNGKWKDMMNMKPRGLPVFEAPVLPLLAIEKKWGWGIAPEGFDTGSTKNFVLPAFTQAMNQSYFIDIFLCDSTTVQWKAVTSAAWIKISAGSGTLSPQAATNEKRTWVTIDWAKAPKETPLVGQIDFSGAGQKFSVKVQAFRPPANVIKAVGAFAEANGYVSMFAQHHTGINQKPGYTWEKVHGLGHTGAAMMTSISPVPATVIDTTRIIQTASSVSYDFFTFNDATSQVLLYALPTLPLNKNVRVRCAFSIDGGALQVVDFTANSTTRTEEWKKNVLSNTAVRKLAGPLLKKGKHTLTVFAIDPGVALDRIIIDLGNFEDAYGVVAETKMH